MSDSGTSSNLPLVRLDHTEPEPESPSGLGNFMDGRKLNFNSGLIGIMIAVMAWGTKELYAEMRLIHDEVLVIKTDMVHRQEFDVQITDLKSRVSSIELQIQQIKRTP